MFSREIAYGLFWVPGWQTVFQTLGCTKSVVQSYFLGLQWEKWWDGQGRFCGWRKTYCQRLSFPAQPSRDKQKAGHPRLGWEDVIKKDLKEMRTSWEGVKREDLNRLGWKSDWDCAALLVSVLRWVVSSSILSALWGPCWEVFALVSFRDVVELRKFVIWQWQSVTSYFPLHFVFFFYISETAFWVLIYKNNFFYWYRFFLKLGIETGPHNSLQKQLTLCQKLGYTP
jgi:hypothetical protein